MLRLSPLVTATKPSARRGAGALEDVVIDAGPDDLVSFELRAEPFESGGIFVDDDHFVSVGVEQFRECGSDASAPDDQVSHDRRQSFRNSQLYPGFGRLPCGDGKGGERGSVKATGFFGAWLSLVERFVRDEEVARSNRVAPISLPPSCPELKGRLFSKFNPAARRVLRIAEQECRNHSHYYVGAEHLLVALLEERDPAMLRALDADGIDVPRSACRSSASARHRRGSAVGRHPDHAAASAGSSRWRRSARASARSARSSCSKRCVRKAAARPRRFCGARRRETQLHRWSNELRGAPAASRRRPDRSLRLLRPLRRRSRSATSACRSAARSCSRLAGALTATGHLSNLWLTIVVALAGELAGGSVGYAIGRYGGVPLIERYGRYMHFTHDAVDASARFFERWGTFAIFICRFLPVMRGIVGDSGRHRGDESGASSISGRFWGR